MGIRVSLVFWLAGCSALVDAGQFEQAPAPGQDSGAMEVDAGDDVDAGSEHDAGERDTGSPVVDAGGMDSGNPPTDAGRPDTGNQVDANNGGTDSGTMMMCGAPPPAEIGTPPCCRTDSDCPAGMGGMTFTCRGAACDQGMFGVCFPEPPPGRCFVDADCPGGRCANGPGCGCTTPCSGMMPMPGTCM